MDCQGMNIFWSKSEGNKASKMSKRFTANDKLTILENSNLKTEKSENKGNTDNVDGAKFENLCVQDKQRIALLINEMAKMSQTISEIKNALGNQKEKNYNNVKNWKIKSKKYCDNQKILKKEINKYLYIINKYQNVFKKQQVKLQKSQTDNVLNIREMISLLKKPNSNVHPSSCDDILKNSVDEWMKKSIYSLKISTEKSHVSHDDKIKKLNMNFSIKSETNNEILNSESVKSEIDSNKLESVLNRQNELLQYVKELNETCTNQEFFENEISHCDESEKKSKKKFQNEEKLQPKNLQNQLVKTNSLSHSSININQEINFKDYGSIKLSTIEYISEMESMHYSESKLLEDCFFVK